MLLRGASIAAERATLATVQVSNLLVTWDVRPSVANTTYSASRNDVLHKEAEMKHYKYLIIGGGLGAMANRRDS